MVDWEDAAADCRWADPHELMNSKLDTPVTTVGFEMKGLGEGKQLVLATSIGADMVGSVMVIPMSMIKEKKVLGALDITACPALEKIFGTSTPPPAKVAKKKKRGKK